MKTEAELRKQFEKLQFVKSVAAVAESPLPSHTMCMYDMLAWVLDEETHIPMDAFFANVDETMADFKKDLCETDWMNFLKARGMG